MDTGAIIRAEVLAATVLSTGAAAFGWRGMLLLVWVGSAVLDYLTGSAAAVKAGAWSSAKAREGLWHKGAMIAVVCAAIGLDLLVRMAQDVGLIHLDTAYRAVLMPTVMAWYTVTELGSSIENAAKMGAKIPKALLDALEAVRKKIEGGDQDQDRDP